MEELRECPFCGSSNISVWDKSRYDVCTRCDNCNSQTEWLPTIADAVTAWNTRPDNWIKFEIEANEGEEETIISPIPDDEQEVLVTDGIGVWQDTFMIDVGCYFDSGYEIIDNITHWMPLPEPPKGDEN